MTLKKRSAGADIRRARLDASLLVQFPQGDLVLLERVGVTRLEQPSQLRRAQQRPHAKFVASTKHRGMAMTLRCVKKENDLELVAERRQDEHEKLDAFNEQKSVVPSAFLT